MAARWLLLRVRVVLALPVLTYPSLTALFTFALWLAFFPIARKSMEPNSNSKTGILVGRILSALIVTGAIALGLVVVYHANYYPRTDDSEILANFIGIAPQVEGPLVRLNVHDNQFVKKGDLLFEIDDRPYRYALEKAISDQATLEGQISDERRRIAALVSAVSVAAANIQSTEADVNRWAAAVDQARADVASAEQGVSRAKAEWTVCEQQPASHRAVAGEAVCHLSTRWIGRGPQRSHRRKR